jgi:hypothetical protein
LAQTVATGWFSDPGQAHRILDCPLQPLLIGVMPTYEHAPGVWKRWLARRNSKDRMSWADFEAKVLEFFKLPKPRIIHAF